MSAVPPEAIDVCPLLCGPGPGNPGTPFAWPVFAIVDTLRILAALGAALLFVDSIRALRGAGTRGQQCRFLYVTGTTVVLAGGQLDGLGNWPTWRFPIVLVVVALGVYGVHQHLHHELPARDAPPKPDESGVP